MESVRIFTFAHKDVVYGFGDDDIHFSLEVGAACRTSHPKTLLHDDDGGDNISIWNPVYAELTGQWWIAKHCSADYIGQQQYRRRFPFLYDYDIVPIFADWNAIACKPVLFGCTVRQHFEYWHSAKYIDACERAVKELYPDMTQSWDRYINSGTSIYYSAGLLLPRLAYLKYSNFLFNVLKHTLSYLGCDSPEAVRTMVERDIRWGLTNRNSSGGVSDNLKYQTQIAAFLGERLMTLWLRHNYEGAIFEAPYNLMENTGI